MFLLYGRRTRFIKAVPITGAKCTHCGNSEAMMMDFFGSYIHVFFIPAAPIGMQAFVSCEHCNKTIKERQFDQSLKLVRNELRKQVSYPKWYFTLVGIIALFFGFIMMMAALDVAGII